MTEMQIGDQTIRYDREATAAKYSAMEQGFVQACGCVFCRNFAVQRDVAYPPSFRAVVEQLGIDLNKEADAFEFAPVDDGCHLYGGGFVFAGELVTSGERNATAADSHYFEYFFTTAGPTPDAFSEGARLRVEFTTHVKWVLAEDPEAARRSGIRPRDTPADAPA